ncbi:MAG: PD40 domain-containing protein [Elusimicrobia bacterium]|nr:PD40 domain-containing protein [Elusimicrobiota bacterium]
MLLATSSWGQFGQNKVIIKDFDWKVTSTEHFDIYYYDGSATWVPKTAEYLEKAYAKVTQELKAPLSGRRPFFLYANVNDMQQTNIVTVGDGIGGVTEPFKDRFMAYADGSEAWLEDVIVHEFGHVVQFAVLMEGFWKSARILKSFVYPLWMMEGMAEYGTGHMDDTIGEMYIRDAATSKGLISLVRLHHFNHLKPHQVTLAYKSGAAALHFLREEYGPDKVGEMLKSFQSRFDVSSVLEGIVGLDIFAFDKKFREYLEEKYARQVRQQGLKEPSEFGAVLTQMEEKIPEFNTSPVFTPDGRGMAYFSTQDGHPPSVYFKDFKTGKVKRIVGNEFRKLENIPLGNFTQIARNLALSPDGRRLAFGGQKNHVEYLYLYDMPSRRLTRIRPEGLQSVAQPVFSPDGSKVAFSAMKDGFTDIYIMDLKTQNVSPVTQDPQDDQSPAFSPDGKFLVFSSEVSDPAWEIPHQRDLTLLELEGGRRKRLTSLSGSERDPVVSPDGSKVLFISDQTGVNEICELDLRRGGVRRLTRTRGGNFTPAYIGEEEIAFSSFRKGSIHVYRGVRSQFLSESVVGEKPAVDVASVPVAVTLTPSRPRRFSASTDLFLPAFFFSSQGGLFWTSFWQGSDFLGNHEAQSYLSYNSGAGLLEYQAAYSYSRYRPQFVFQARGLQTREGLSALGLTFDEKAHQQIVGMLYPLDRFHRLELLAASQTDHIQYSGDQGITKNEARMGEAAFVRDTASGRYLVATYGSRIRLSYLRTERILGGNQDFYTQSAEIQKFFPLGSLNTLAFRVVGAGSFGPNQQSFELGGVGWVRGFTRSPIANNGSRFVVSTAEWRFPVLKDLNYYMWYIFPDFYFKAIFGTLFWDVGYGWSNHDEMKQARISSLLNSVGVGIRFHTFVLQMFPLVLSFDYAWKTTNGGKVLYFYFGPVF